MPDENKKRDTIQLIDLIGRRSNNTPNFALLIGAGTSVSSGVKTASQMIEEWRQQLYERSRCNESLQDWLKNQEWYEDDEEYSILFEKICDQPSQRQIYIEGCVKDAKPSWGYIYLANIIAKNYFNVVFTTNFDDLLNDACFLYSDLRPIVCAHDSAVEYIRVTSTRPKIIKLHGDFLYNNIKNTPKETKSLEENMKEKFERFAEDYGLIVIGYSGSDRSVMDILDATLSSKKYFPNGLYWCMRKNSKPSRKLNSLINDKENESAYWVEIEGFDEFMAELHDGLGLTLPDSVRDPYKAVTEKLNKFITPEKKIENEIIKRHIAELEEQIRKFERIVSGEASEEESDNIIPYKFLGDQEFKKGNYEKAIVNYEKALAQEPDDLEAMEEMSLSYIAIENFSKALEVAERMIKQSPDHWFGYYQKGTALSHFGKLEEAISSIGEALRFAKKGSEAQSIVLNGRSNDLLLAGKWEDALSDAQKALEIDPKNYEAIINQCIALKKLGKDNEANNIIQNTLADIKDNRSYANVMNKGFR